MSTVTNLILTTGLGEERHGEGGGTSIMKRRGYPNWKPAAKKEAARS